MILALRKAKGYPWNTYLFMLHTEKLGEQAGCVAEISLSSGPFRIRAQHSWRYPGGAR
jgi:hypothetical protein